MLRWTLIFLVVALLAAVFGFTGIAADAAWIAKILFFVFLVLFVVSLIFGKERAAAGMNAMEMTIDLGALATMRKRIC